MSSSRFVGSSPAKAPGRYGMESVSQTEHALQCATLAERDGAPPSLVVAALLHDIGHLLNRDEVGAFLRGEDARHEERGARYLGQWFARGRY